MSSNALLLLLSFLGPLAAAEAAAPGRRTTSRLLPPGATSNIPKKIQPAPRGRNLQDVVCSFPLDDLVVSPLQGQLLPPSVLETCLSNIPVDGDNMLLHIKNLDETFRQSYAFYNVARDPDASDPANFQPELGNAIYEGPYEGQVDIAARLADISAYVEENGAANATTFWDIAEVFAQLNDAHVQLSVLPEGSPAGQYVQFVLPERCLGEDLTTLARAEFKYVDDELRMTVLWAEVDIDDNFNPILVETGESVVSTIDGKAPIDYITSLANSPISVSPYKSLGSRINALFSGFASNPEALGSTTFNPFVHIFLSLSSPLKILPDSFLVEYDDGTQETYFVGLSQGEAFALLSLDSDGMVVMDRAEAISVTDQPGRTFENYEKALGRLEGPPKEAKFNQTRGIDVVMDEPMEIPEMPENRRRVQESFKFDKSFVNIGAAPAGGYVVGEDYAVFKIADFLVLPDEIVAAWTEMTTLCQKNGIDKVIVDISGNGGGVAVSGEIMTAAMFPNMEYKWFEERFDVVYNDPMNLWQNDVGDAIEALFARLAELTEEELQGIVDGYSNETLTLVQNIADTIKLFCLENCEDLDACERFGIDRCNVAERLSAETAEFVADPSLAELGGIINTLFETLVSFNPWTVVGFLAFLDAEAREVMRTVNRGGVETDLTKATSILTPDVFANVTSGILGIGHNFDQYILLSNGAGGSTTQIFQSGVTQLYRNRDRATGVTSRVTAVSYGGNNNLDDMTLAGFPAVVDTVFNKDPIIAAAGLYMTFSLIPNGTELSDAFADVGTRYFESLASPPYYSDNYPTISVVNYYDSFMNPGALPLEYVAIPPDEHIPQIYTGVSLSDTSDLTELYGEAAKFFSAEKFEPEVTEVTSAPTQAPVASDGSTMAPVASDATMAPVASDATMAPTASPVSDGTTASPVAPDDVGSAGVRDSAARDAGALMHWQVPMLLFSSLLLLGFGV